MTAPGDEQGNTGVEGTALPLRRIGTVWVNPHTNAVLGEPGEATDPVLRHYFDDVGRALDHWGSLDGEVAARGDIHEIVSQIVETSGAGVHDIYVPDSRIYVALTTSAVPDTAAIWIHHGFVDHRQQLPGSEPSGTPGVWRTPLSTSGLGGTGSANNTPSAVRTATCPNCFISVPVSSECGQCDWRPAGS